MEKKALAKIKFDFFNIPVGNIPKVVMVNSFMIVLGTSSKDRVDMNILLYLE